MLHIWSGLLLSAPKPLLERICVCSGCERSITRPLNMQYASPRHETPKLVSGPPFFSFSSYVPCVPAALHCAGARTSRTPARSTASSLRRLWCAARARCRACSRHPAPRGDTEERPQASSPRWPRACAWADQLLSYEQQLATEHVLFVAASVHLQLHACACAVFWLQLCVDYMQQHMFY